MNNRVLCIIVAAMAGLLAPVFNANAEVREWKIDKAHSNVYFDVVHIFSTTRGRFEDFSGTLRIDPENVAASSLSLTIDVDSINTDIAKRDNHLRGDDFFAASDYPEITFTSAKITHNGGESYTVQGELTMKDVTRQVSLPMTFLGVKEHPAKKGTDVAGLDVAFALDRLEYNVGDGRFAKMGLVSNEVNILVSFELLD